MCDRTGALTGNVQIASNDFYIPHLMLADADGYYSVLLPKHKWNGPGKLSVSAPDFHEKTVSLDPFYSEGPFNTRNDIALVPIRRTIALEITRAEDVMERAFHLTYAVDSRKTMKLNPYFINTDSFTETLSVPAGDKRKLICPQ